MRGRLGGTAARAAAALGAPVLVALLACGSDPRGHDPERTVTDEEVPVLLAALQSDDAAAVEGAAARIEEAGDRRFIAVLIELLHASQMGLVGGAGYDRRVVALERLSGAPFGADWFAWAEWYAGTALVPPPGFGDWKGALFARLDPAYADWLASARPSRLRLEEVHWGGVPVDGIPALDAPAFVSVSEASYLEPGEAVVGLELAGEARAYPLRILDWHEVVNDRVGGIDVSVTICTLCGSAIGYLGSGADGSPLRFGTSGLLYRSNKLLYDRATRTLWEQLTGRPVLGSLAEGGAPLRVHPVVVTTWEAWRTRHPETRVLSLETGYERDYRPGNPYGGYFASTEKLFPVFEARPELPGKERIYGLALQGTSKAWPLAALVEQQVVNDRIGGAEVVLVATGGRISVEGEVELFGSVRYEAGGPVRSYRSDGHRFAPGPDGRTLLDDQGGSWAVEEEALQGPDGARLPRLPGTLAYWFAWQSFYPRTLVYRP